MKSSFFSVLSLVFIFLISTSVGTSKSAQEFQARAYYFSKSKMELGNWGARLSEAQKKQIAARMKNRLEKGYVLSFNKEESLFVEEDQLDAISGATDSWGKNFAPGKQYKNVKTNTQLQEQEFYGKKFLVNDLLQELIPMTSKASICSVTRIVPMLEVIKDPTFPAIITEINVGANSKITDCRVANPTKYLGISGLSIFRAV